MVSREASSKGEGERIPVVYFRGACPAAGGFDHERRKVDPVDFPAGEAAGKRGQGAARTAAQLQE